MAPNKKKGKKVAANPARGFATTSVVSKSKLESADTSDSQPAAVDQADSQSLEAASLKPTEGEAIELDDLSKLSPEELEARLEESEIQLFIEKHRPKVKKEVSRHVSRLLTERRLLRKSAVPLSLTRWFSDSLTQIISEQMKEQNAVKPDVISTPNTMTVDELVIKLWALRQCLIGLGISAGTADSALAKLLQDQSMLAQAKVDEAKDGIWGLSAVLDWFGLSKEESELPSYDVEISAKDRTGNMLDGNNPGLSGMCEQAKESDSQCRINIKFLESKTAQSLSGTATHRTTGSSLEVEPRKSNAEKNTPDLPQISSKNDKEEAESETDDEDLEPFQRQERYLKLKSRLHERRPDLTEVPAPFQNKKPKKVPGTEPPDAYCGRILRRIRKLESDILFDKDSALDAWRELRIQLLKNAAERKKLGLREGKDEDASKRESSKMLDETRDSEVMEMGVGDFFSGLPSEDADAENGKTLTTTLEDGTQIAIRDFGKWTGLSPRRILEETCRARDSSVKIHFTLVSSTSFSTRHSIKVIWSRPQDAPDETSLPGIICRYDERTVIIEMSTISTPDKMQSEAFISVVGLFLLFAPYSKEEKVFMRLPAVWRDLWTEFSQLRQQRIYLEDRTEVQEIRKLVDSLWKVDQEERSSALSKDKEVARNEQDLDNVVKLKLDLGLDPSSLASLWASKVASPLYQRMLEGRMQLPMWYFKEQMLQAVDTNQVVIICGETGCGKSTQVPSFLLEHELSNGRDCKIYCTEPRRISAISLARRVSEELGERKSDVGTSRSLVGYAIRLESHISPQTKLIYATTGIVMRMLENSQGFEAITHIILDEVHERTIDSDFLLIILRKLLLSRPSLKVILMSATVNAEQFSRYLNNAPILNVPGRTFPVEVQYLEDAVEAIGKYSNLQSVSLQAEEMDGEEFDTEDGQQLSVSGSLEGYSNQTRKFIGQFNEYRIDFGLVVKLLEVIATQQTYTPFSNAILVFLPGLAEIRRLNDMLIGHATFSRGWQIFPLHSTIATEAQEAAFLIPPHGVRKIVLATNIAETGITIPDITCVVDLGKHREMRFVNTNLQCEHADFVKV
jgi:ATP-dependent RNA helicase DHX29